MANKRTNKCRKITQRQQAAATPKLHPRGLARSVAKGICGGDVPKDWRNWVAKLPKNVPVKKKSRYLDCSGEVVGRYGGK